MTARIWGNIAQQRKDDMRTKRFCELIELAIKEEFPDVDSEFDRVPYIPEEGGEMRECLGIFLFEGVHMATVAARAMYLLYVDTDNLLDDPLDMDAALGDFADLMGTMRVAPYMQWHCAYFPGLTAEQVLAESEAGDEPTLYVARTDPGERMSSADLFAEFSNLGGVGTTWYSGRDMMGAQCVSIAADTLDAIQSAIGTVRERANDATRTALSVYRTDSLGKGLITYFPDFTKEQP